MKKLLLIFLICISNFTFAKTYAVIVGVEQYDGSVPNLNASVDDAVRMYQFLVRGNSAENIILLSDAKATKQNILSAMQIFKKAEPEDVVIFYFSGHGSPYLFCPQNFSGGTYALWHTEVKNAFKQSRAKVKLCIADACYSGSIKLSQRPPSTSGNSESIIVFMSSTQTQTSQESYQYLTGYFTSYLIKGLGGLADQDKDRKVSAIELYTYVKNGVSKASNGTQTPVMFGKFNKYITLSQY